MNLFVARLNPATTTRDLQKLFEHYGSITNAEVIFDHKTGRSKGYGFIGMPDNREAHEAIKELNYTFFQGNVISVRESKPHHFRILTEDSGFRNRNGAVYSTGNGNLQESNSGAVTPTSPPRQYKIRRNFGYRGSGLRNF
jgi:RNA recognition motif-containing protein